MDATTSLPFKKDRRTVVRWTWSESLRDALELEAARMGVPASRHTEDLAILGHWAKAQGMKLPDGYEVSSHAHTPPEAA